MKTLVRSLGDSSVLTELDTAALRWARVTPDKHNTWFLHGNGCCPAERERQARGLRQSLHEAWLWQNPPARPEKYAADTPKQVWCTRTMLELRGWTAAAMRDYLPEPEGYKQNPHYSSAHPMPVWRAETIGTIEATEHWQQWLTRSLTRRKLTSVTDLRHAADERLAAKLDAVDAAMRQRKQA